MVEKLSQYDRQYALWLADPEGNPWPEGVPEPKRRPPTHTTAWAPAKGLGPRRIRTAERRLVSWPGLLHLAATGFDLAVVCSDDELPTRLGIRFEPGLHMTMWSPLLAPKLAHVVLGNNVEDPLVLDPFDYLADDVAAERERFGWSTAQLTRIFGIRRIDVSAQASVPLEQSMSPPTPLQPAA
jgi:hypothetical protein